MRLSRAGNFFDLQRCVRGLFGRMLFGAVLLSVPNTALSSPLIALQLQQPLLRALSFLPRPLYNMVSLRARGICKSETVDDRLIGVVRGGERKVTKYTLRTRSASNNGHVRITGKIWSGKPPTLARVTYARVDVHRPQHANERRLNYRRA